jgi:hypothetical protein
MINNLVEPAAAARKTALELSRTAKFLFKFKVWVLPESFLRAGGLTARFQLFQALRLG